jgi:cell division protein FtsN
MLGGTNLWGDLERLLDYAMNLEPTLSDPPALLQVAETQEAPAAKLYRRPEEISRPQFRYHVQIASFTSRAKANNLRQRVTKQGFAASVEKAKINARQMYRVTVRNFESRALARQAARTLGKTYQVQPLIVAVRA